MNKACISALGVTIAVAVAAFLTLNGPRPAYRALRRNSSAHINSFGSTDRLDNDNNNTIDDLVPSPVGRGRWLIRSRELLRECSSSTGSLCRCSPPVAASQNTSLGCEWSWLSNGYPLQSISRDSFTKRESIATGQVAVWNTPAGDRYPFVHPWSCVQQSMRRQPRTSRRGVAQVMFLGHSHSRVMTAMLCMMLNMSRCHLFKKQLRTVDVSSVAEDVTTVGGTLGANVWRTDHAEWLALSFVRTLYDLKERMFAVRRVLEGVVDLTHSPPWTTFGVNSTNGSLLTSPGKLERATAPLFPLVVIYSRGAWDLAYLDTPLPQFYREFTASLLKLNEVLPGETQIIVYPHHATQRIKGKDKWQKNLRNVCLGDRRARRLRNATFCAIRAAIESSDAHVKAGGGGTALIDRIRIFDVWDETRAPMPLTYTDYGGHHYKDIILEALTMKLLRDHICPVENRDGGSAGVKARIELLLEQRVSREYCDEQFGDAADSVPQVESCSCHNASAVNNPICVAALRGGKRK